MGTRLSFMQLIFLILMGLNASYATVLVIPEAGGVVGEIQYAASEVGESIDDVGRRFSIGYYEMVRANPKVDARHTLAAQTSLVIPSQFILPPTPRNGIVINLAEYRLYYFPPDDNVVITFPVGIGKIGWSTPLGLTKVTAKVTNPIWKPTANILAAAEEMGAPIPDEFPPGPNNPLGKHVLRLGWPAFLIHGTNRVDGIGARVSAGCIRMLPDDIEYLFNMVPVGTAVRVINEPVKISQQDDSIFLQMYPLLSDQKRAGLRDILARKLAEIGKPNQTNNQIISNELVAPTGIVRKII